MAKIKKNIKNLQNITYVIGEPQSEENRKDFIPVPGLQGDKGDPGILVFNSISEMRNISDSDVAKLKSREYKSVILNGYYGLGDTFSPIYYYLSETLVNDNGYSVIAVKDIKLEHDFRGVIDISYLGVKTNDASTFARLNIENVTYVFTRQYNIDGLEFNVPSGCTFDMTNGGVFNGVLVSHNTKFINPTFSNTVIYGKCYNAQGNEITVYNWEVVTRKVELTYSLSSSDAPTSNFSVIQKCIKLGISDFNLVIKANYNLTTLVFEERNYPLSELVALIKRYNLTCKKVKFHLDEQIGLTNPGYNTQEYRDKNSQYILTTLAYLKTQGIEFNKVWVANEQTFYMNKFAVYYIEWKTTHNALIANIKSIYGTAIECWASTQDPSLAFSMDNTIYQISVNWYPKMSMNNSGVITNADLSSDLKNALSEYVSVCPENKKFLITECGVKPQKGALKAPHMWQMSTDYDINVAVTYYSYIIDAVNKESRIDGLGLWFLSNIATNDLPLIYKILMQLR